MIRQLAHLNFVTNDLSKTIDFYVNKLGMRVKFTLDNKDGVWSLRPATDGVMKIM